MDTITGGDAVDDTYNQPVSSKGHTRAYQACLQCRHKKQKCDMGPVDDPHPPPCASCRRESKPCTFTPNRSRSSTVGSPRTFSETEQAEAFAFVAPMTLNSSNDCIEKKAQSLSGHTILDPTEPMDVLGDLREKNCRDKGPAKQGAGDAQYALTAISVKEAWGQFELVRNGLISAFEAIAYVDFFYSKLWPLTATPLEDYRHVSKHPSLLRNEPVLAVTLLTIASRYAPLSGAGSKIRSVIVHDRLSDHLRNMLQRLHYSEEPFSAFSMQIPGSVTTKLRSLGTIEALLLLVDWNPRFTHHPTDSGSNLLDADLSKDAPSLQYETKSRIEAMIFQGYKTPKEQREMLLKPCRKSDQLCLSYLNMAMLIANQTGLFKKDPLKRNSYMILPGETTNITHRRNRIRCLLFVHAAFLAGKLSMPSLYPKEHEALQFSPEILDTAYGRSNAKVPNEIEPENTQFARDVAIYFWYRLAYDVVSPANEELYPSKEFSHELVRSGAYADKMHSYLTELDDFKIGLDKCKFIPKLLRYNLLIDYYYCRMMIANFGLQAVAFRFDKSGQRILSVENRRDGLMSIIGNDQKYVVEVVESCRALLKTAIQKLDKFQALPFAIHRVYMRIVSASTILLQAFMFGTTTEECQTTIEILRETVKKLGSSKMNDLHLAAPIAETLEDQLKDLQKILVCIAPALSSDPATESTTAAAVGGGHSEPSSSKATQFKPKPAIGLSRHDHSSLPDHFASLATDPEPTRVQTFDHFIADAPQVNPSDPGLLVMPPLIGSQEFFEFGANDETFNNNLPAEWFSLPLESLVGTDTTFGDFNVDQADNQVHNMLNRLAYPDSQSGPYTTF